MQQIIQAGERWVQVSEFLLGNVGISFHKQHAFVRAVHDELTEGRFSQSSGKRIVKHQNLRQRFSDNFGGILTFFLRIEPIELKDGNMKSERRLII